MPIYEYRCENGHTFEVMQPISDAPLTRCTECGAAVQRVFHPVAVHFKGKGFYNTDYGTRRRQRELSEAAEGGAKGEGGGDSAKPDAKSDGAAAKKTEKPADKPAKKPAASDA